MNKKLILAAAVAVGFMFPDLAEGAPGKTHVGQPPGNHVVLEAVGTSPTFETCPDGVAFVRNLTDGTHVTSGIFLVPLGSVLVVTDVDWQYVSPLGSISSGKRQTLRLNIANIPACLGEDIPEDCDFGRRVFESTIVLNSEGEGGASESMTSGFLVSSDGKLCPDLTPISGFFGAVQHLIVRGYLVKG